ncbi:MAG: hypothetical protein HY815_14800 [Candidatus Riflebacteria bacterium]|nr:hypothetical protein [Candidatus Riflebacteria bacterium]
MKILAFDIGTGTKDVLLYDSERKLENCIKMVLTSPTVVHAGQIESLSENLFLDGHIVGGGPLVHACLRHLKKGHKVVFSLRAASAVKNERSRVEEMGFTVGDNPGYRTIHLDELQLDRFYEFLRPLGEDPATIDGLCLAVQDHGKAEGGTTDRSFRFDTFVEHLKRDPSLDVFIYTPETLPDCFMRMHCALEYFKEHSPDKKIVMMDTCMAALKGSLLVCPEVKGPVAILNCGNSHSMGAVIRENRILALFEHHTKILKKNPQRYVHYVTGLAAGTISSEEIFREDGEGAFIFEKVGVDAIEAFFYTGPRRGLLDGLSFPFRCKPQIATPGGDMMMTGTVGLVDAFRKAHRLDLPLTV